MLGAQRPLGLTAPLTRCVILGLVVGIGILLMLVTLLKDPAGTLVGESGMALRCDLVVLMHPCGIMHIGLVVRRSSFRSAEFSSKLAKLL